MTEEEIKRQAEEWQKARKTEKRRRNQAQYRKKLADAKYGARIETLEILHRERFLSFLIGVGVVAKEDAKIRARIDEATDELLRNFEAPHSPEHFVRSFGTNDCPCTVKVRMDAAIVDFLVEYETERSSDGLLWCKDCRPSRPCKDCVAAEAQFKQNLRSNRVKLKAVAENLLYFSYATWTSDRKPSTTAAPIVTGLIDRVAPPRLARPLALVKKPKDARWKRRWDKYDNDPVIRSHARSAAVGMQGRFAGTTGRHVVGYLAEELPPETDGRASTRDFEKTAREGEKAIEKPFDAPTGTPKSWANRSDVEPDDDRGVKRIGSRLIEEATIEPPKEPEN